MRLRISIIALCLTAVVLCIVPSVYAGDVLARLTHGDQYSLVLGTVVSVSDTTARFEVETIISGESLPSVVGVQVPGGFMEMLAPHMRLEPSDYAVLSLDKEATKYTIAWGFFKVSSLDIATLEIIEGPLPPGDLAALQWYINSGGVENDFYFSGTTAYVRHPDGTSTQLYPPTDEPAEVEPSSDSVEGSNNKAQASSGTSDGTSTQLYPPTDEPAEVEPSSDSVEGVNNKAQASSGTSKGSISDEEAASEVVATPQGGKAFASEWRYVLIAVVLVLAGCFTYRIIKTKQSAC